MTLVLNFFYGYEWRLPWYDKIHLIKKCLHKEILIKLFMDLIKAS